MLFLFLALWSLAVFLLSLSQYRLPEVRGRDLNLLCLFPSSYRNDANGVEYAMFAEQIRELMKVYLFSSNVFLPRIACSLLILKD